MALASPSTSSVKLTRSADDSKHNIPLIGRTVQQIIGAKLPSHRQALQSSFFFICGVEIAEQRIRKKVLIWW